jgi:hypothetical protein
MSADMKWPMPRAIDWEDPAIATDDEVMLNARALRATLDAAIEMPDLPALRHMLNEVEWRLWRWPSND